jgi:hypothetical protein
MKRLALLFSAAVIAPCAWAEPVTTRGIIDPQKTERPADATVLIGETSYDLLPESNAACKWVFADGVLTASPLWDSVVTKETYQDFRMHVEFNVNEVPDCKDPEQNGNSGIYIQKRYELQILNSFGIPEDEYKASYCGGIYKQKKPDKIACKKAGEWQTYEIAFRAARFVDGKKTENARITVYHNGELIHDDYELAAKTGAGDREGPTPAVIKFQGHHNPVRFRNSWIQRLSLEKNAAQSSEPHPRE